ncbi:MAG: hypothetical protein H6565_14945 [Lewinellaceae bacterium]|nr:hypothetical protein [Saprospiraceae bacterium]MCB9307892.1 hypothetical protein [Lewinellaceae bacterium]MCB9356352.1 hypothetical protein [Lewinellaceae bacterium]
MKNGIYRTVKIFALLFLLSGSASPVAAQCPMCRMSAESNLKNGGTDGRGLNAGILYMLSMPYLIAAGIGFWWWRNRKNEGRDEQEFSEDDFAHYN